MPRTTWAFLACCALPVACGGDASRAVALLSVTATSFPPVALVDQPVQFQAVISRGKGPYRLSWTFGDGSTSLSSQSPSHAYRNPGAYTVRVEVEDSAGERADAQLSVLVLDDVPASAAAQVSPAAGEAPLTVQFTATGGGDLPVAYAWEFGDGTGSGLQNPTHTFRDAGTYTATLRVTDANGEQAIHTVTVTVSAPPPPPAPPPPDRQPIASPVALVASGTAPFTTDFVANAAGGDGALTYLWDFGDGSTSTDENPTHTFAAAARYRIQFSATDADGDEVRATLFVQALADRQPTVSIVQAFPTVGCGSLNASLRAAASGGDDPYTYAWDFGDGTPGATGDSVAHAFNGTGTFRVKVTATDADGDTAEATASVFVFAQEALQVSASISPVEGPAPLTVNFSAGTTCGRAPFRIDWDFGDGLTASGSLFIRHTYDAPGEYDTLLRVTDSSTPTPIVRNVNIRIRALENVPRLAVSSFGVSATGTQACYAAVIANNGSATTQGCYALRGSSAPAICGVLAGFFANRATAPVLALPSSGFAAGLPAIPQGTSAGPVDLRACIAMWRAGADAVRFLPAAIGPAERWPVNLCLERPPGVDRPWVAAAINDPEFLLRRADLAFATTASAGPLTFAAIRINEVGSDFVELRGLADMSLSGHTLEVQQGASISACVLSGTLGTTGVRSIGSASCPGLAPPASGAAVRLRAGTTVLDVVGYGTAPPAVEGAAAPALPAGGSIARVPDGVDTNSNAADFAALPSPTPDAPNPPRGDVATAPLPLALNACAAFSLAGAGNEHAAYGPTGLCTPGDCSGPDQVLAFDVSAGNYRLDVVAFEMGAVAGWHVVRAPGTTCTAAGELVLSGAGDAVGASLPALAAGRYCVFVDGAPGFSGSVDYVALLTRGQP